MIRAVLTNVLLVGLKGNITMPQESITSNSKKTHIHIENIEKYKEGNKQHPDNNEKKIQEKKKKHCKNKDTCYDKNSKYREETREAIRQPPRERYR